MAYDSRTDCQNLFEEVRSGRNPDYASSVMAEQVLAHQVISEDEVTVTRKTFRLCGSCARDD